MSVSPRAVQWDPFDNCEMLKLSNSLSARLKHLRLSWVRFTRPYAFAAEHAIVASSSTRREQQRQTMVISDISKIRVSCELNGSRIENQRFRIRVFPFQMNFALKLIDVLRSQRLRSPHGAAYLHKNGGCSDKMNFDFFQSIVQ